MATTTADTPVASGGLDPDVTSESSIVATSAVTATPTVVPAAPSPVTAAPTRHQSTDGSTPNVEGATHAKPAAAVVATGPANPASFSTGQEGTISPTAAESTDPSVGPTASVNSVAPTVAVSNTTSSAQLPAANTVAVSAVTMAAADPAVTGAYTAHQPTILSLIGSLVFNVFTAGFALFQGPPQLPPGSTVTIHSSTLALAPGHVVPVDWYVPQNPDPTRLIYFQNGFITNAAPYSYTLAALAQNTNSIVVAPSISSNFFASDGFWLAGVPAQHAVANLFTGNRDALTASAAAALGHPFTVPRNVVLTGHSYGAGTVLGAAAIMVANGTSGDLKGVVLLDGVPTQITADATLANISDSIPVYDLASRPYFWNSFGLLSDALVAARPGQFTGVQLVNGSHVDSMQGGNPITQFIGYLATGFSQPANVDAVKTLASGWIDDMFTGIRDRGIYAAPGATITIPSAAGAATANVPPVQNAPVDPISRLIGDIGNFAVARFFNFLPTQGPLALF